MNGARALLMAFLLLPAACLAEDDFGALQKQAQRAAAQGEWDEARRAIAGVAADDSKRAVDALLKLVQKHGQAPVYRAVRDGLAKMSSVEAVDQLCKKLAARAAPEARMVLIDACAARDDAATAGALVALLGEVRRPEEQRAAVNAARHRRLVPAVPALIDMLQAAEEEDPDGLLVHDIGDALAGIAGERRERAADWRTFWEQRGADFRPATGEPPPRPAEATRTRPTFFGTEVVSNRVVFVIDVSTSMEREDPVDATGSGRPTTGGPQAQPAPGSDSRVRIDRAKFQLSQCIDALPDRARFTIIAYSGYLEDARSLGEGYRFPADVPPKGDLPAVIGGVPWLQVWKPKLTAAGGNKDSAKRFVAGLQPNGSTFTLRALLAGLEVPDADTIILLSDGSPTEIHGRKAEALLTAREILDEVETANRLRRVRIDTFGVGVEDEQGFGQFMQQLAARNGGSFTRVR